MASNDNLLKLYNGLKDNNFSVPDNFESFERTLAAPGNEGINNRQTLYKALKRSNYSVPDNYESFRNTLFGPDIDLAGEALDPESGLTKGANAAPAAETGNVKSDPESGPTKTQTGVLQAAPDSQSQQAGQTASPDATVSTDSVPAQVRLAYGASQIRNMVDPQFRQTSSAPTPAGDALAEVEAGRKNAVEAWKEVQRSMSPSWLQSAKGTAARGDVAASMRSTFAQPGEDASTVMQKAAVIRRARERREAERRWENPDLLRDRVEEVIDRAEQEAATVGARAGAGAPTYAQSFMAGTQEQAQKAANMRINNLSEKVIEAMGPDIELIAERLRASGGYTEEDVQYEIQNYMESTIPQYIYETLKSRNTPKNDLEYITSSTYGQWMSTALTDYISGKLGGSKEYRMIQQQSLQDYVSKLQPVRATALELTSGVLGMATDPTNALLMGVGGMAAGKAADWTFRRSAAALMARGTSQGVKVETALRMLPANLAYRTTMRLAQGSGSFAAFEMGSQAKQDIGAGEFSGWGVYGSKFGKGLALGAATAGAGVFIGSASKRLEKALLDRGANSAAVGAVDVATKMGVAPAVEAALFTAGEVATGDKGVSEYTAGELAGMFGSNLGFVYGMKLWHGPERVIKERFKDNPRAQKWFTSVRDAVAHPVRTLRDIGERARLLDDGLLTADEWKNVERVLGYDIRSLKGMARASESAGSITNSRGRTEELFQGLSMAMTSPELSLREKAVVSSLFGMRMAIPDVAKVEREGNVVSTYDTRGQLVRRVDGGSDKAAEQLFVSGQQAVDLNNLFYLQMGIADRYNAEDLPADVLERMWAVACKRAGVDFEKYTDPVSAVKAGSDAAAKAVLDEWRSMMWELASRRPVGMPEESHRVALKDGREGVVVGEAETENAVSRSKQRWLTVEMPDGSRIIVDEGAIAEEQRLPMSAEERLTAMVSALDMTALGKSQREAVELWLRDRTPDEPLLAHARLAGRIIDGTASEEERAEAERLGVDVEFFRRRLSKETDQGTEAGTEAPSETGNGETETGEVAAGESRVPDSKSQQTEQQAGQPASPDATVSADSAPALPVMLDGTPDIARAADAESGRRAVLEMFDGDTVAAREYVAATMGALEAEAEALRKPQGYGRELADNIRRRRSLEKKIERLKEIDNALTESPAQQLPTEPEINMTAGDSGRVPVYADGTPNFLAAKPVDAYDALLKWVGGDKGAADDYIMEMRIRLEKELRSAPEGRKTDIMRELDKWTAIAQEASRRETEAGLKAKESMKSEIGNQESETGTEAGTEAVLPKTDPESGLTEKANDTEGVLTKTETGNQETETGKQQAGQAAQQTGTVSADSAPAAQKALDDFRTRRVEEHLSPELKSAINDLRLKLQGVSAPALVNGWHESGKVFVNVDRETGTRSVWIVGHEIGHEMEDLDPKGYDRWRTSVMDELYARDEEGTQQQFREFKDAYFNQVYRSRYNEEIAAGHSADEAHRRASDYADSIVTDEYVYTEMANNFLGDLAADAATARRAFASMEPGLATRVARYIGRFYTRLLEAVGADEAVARRRAAELADDFNLIYRQQVKRLNEEHQDGEIERAVSERTDGVAFNADGEVVAEVTDGVPRFSLYTWENGGRDALKRYLEGQIVDPKRKSKKKDSKGPRTPQPGLTRREVDNMMKEMDRMHAYAMELAKGNPNGLFGQWSVQTVRMVDGTEVPLLRALKDNAEYRLNIDFSTVCKKRMVMDALMNDLIRRGWLQHESLSPQDVARINQIIQQHGLEIACGICFVDSRRYNATKFAEGFLNKFNPIIKSLGAEVPAGFNYSGNTAFSNEGKRDYSAVRESVDWSRVFSPEGIDEAEMAKYELDWHAVADILEPLRVRAARYMRGKKAVEKVDSDGKKLKDKDGNPVTVEVDCNFDADFDAARRKQYEAELTRMIQADRKARGMSTAKSDIKAAEYDAAWAEYRKQLPEPSASERWNFAWAKMMNGGYAEQKMAMAISQSPELRKVAKVEDFIASEGWENVRQQNTGLERLWNIQKGAAGAKPNERFAPYQNDVLEKKLPNADIYDIGGYRMQSFSDFVGRMYFDYLQAFADLAAMQLPGHAYTKEPNFVKLFGMMGMKINMSLVCDVDKDVVNELGKDFAGLTRDADGNLTYNVAETLRGADGEIIKQGQTFPAEEAFALQADPRFSRNAGTIMVGLSREHILMGLRDPRIRMVIPYHKSGLPHGVAMILNLSEINDYEPVQSTRRRDGKKMTAADRNAVDNYNFILHQLSIAKDRELAYNALRYIMVDRKMTGEIHEEYNKALRRVKADRAKNPDSYRRIDISERERDDTFIAKVAADIYLDACDAHGYIPRFDEFRGEHGYYKTLVDFSVYDHEGNYAPQEAVRFQLPERVDEYIRESLEHDEGINAKAVSENEGLIDDIVTYLGNRELRDRQDMAAKKKDEDAEKKKDEDVLTTIYNVGDFRNVPEVVAVAPSGPEGSPSPDRGSRIADALGVPAERRFSLSPEGRAEAVGRVGAERQKLPGARLTENTLKLDWADPELRWSLSRNARQQVEGWLRKRGDLSDEERGAVVDYIDKDIEDRKVQLAAGWWSAKGSVRLPEDLEKIKQAVKVAEVRKGDFQRYDSPMALIEDLGDIKTKEPRIDPESVPTLHRAKELPDGVVIYDVDEGQQSRENMRRIINTHFGPEASPWCLLQGDGKGNLTEKSAKYWNHYSVYPKQVAFKDGKLLAFSANDSDKRVWWDRQDKATEGIPSFVKVPGDELGRSRYVLTDTETGEVSYTGNYFKGDEKNGIYQEWAPNGQIIKSENRVNGEKEGLQQEWYDNGLPYREVNYNDGLIEGLERTWYNNGNLWSSLNYKNGELDGEAKSYNRDGALRNHRYYKNGHLDGEYTEYYYDGHLMLQEHWKNGRVEGETKEWWKNGNLRFLSEYRDDKRNGVSEEYEEDGRLRSRYTYVDGMKDGPSMLIHRDEFGTFVTLGNYKRGGLVGESINYRTDGKSVSITNYGTNERPKYFFGDEAMAELKARGIELGEPEDPSGRRYSLANEQRRDIAMAMERATGHSVRFGRPPRGAAGFDVAGHLIVDPDRCASAAAVESAVGHVLADALPLPTLSSPELYNSTMDNIWRNLPAAVRDGYAARGANDAERVVQYLADVAQDKSGAGRRAWNAAINGFRSAVRRQRGIRLETGDIELSLLEHLASANSSPLLKAEAVRARRDWEVADELAGRDASLEDEVVTVSTSDGGRRRFVALSEIDALRASITEAKEEELEANVRAVERYLRDRLSPEIATRFGKRKILELADRLKDGAVSKKGLQNVLMQAEMAIGESEMRAAMDSLRKTLKTPTMRINSRQEREANRVDADTAAFFSALRDNLQEVLRKTYSDDEVELRATLKDLNARIDSGLLSEEELAAAREELKTANRELDVAREERKRVEASRAHDSFVAVEDRYRDLSQRLLSGGQLSDSERRELSALPLRLRVMRVNALMRDFLAAVNAPADERAVIASDMMNGGTYDAVIDAYLAQVAQLPASKVNDRIKMQRAITAEIRELTDILTGRLEDGRMAYQEWQNRIATHDSDLLKAAVHAVGGAREIAPSRRSRARQVAQRYFGSLRDSVWDAFYDTFNHMVQMIDVRSMPKSGFLYNYFITSPETGYMANYGRYIDLRNSYRDRVKRKMEELLPKEERDRYNEEHAIVLSLRDGEGNVIRQFERSYTVGQLMYEYLLSRMRSGREKLRMMGFDEAAQSAVGRALGSGYMDLADWISDTLLDDLYQEQNRTYRALHGINLGRVVNYFPFRYSQQEVSKPGDLVEEYVQSMTSGISSEKHRTANNKALDLTQDAMSILDRHIDNGARQAAMGRFNRDLSVLLSSGEFVEALRSQGASLPDRFRRVCNLAAGVERRNSEAELQNFVNRMLSGGCIAYRLNTALKQLLSLPAFVLEGDNISWGKDLAQATLGTLRRGDGNTIRWCYENLPLFRDRWDSRALGDIRMVDENLGRISNMLNTKGGVEVVGKKVMDASGNVVRVGMLPNGMIDVFACSVGAKAMYEHRLRRYLDEVDARMKVWTERFGEDNPGREKERERLVAQAHNWAKCDAEQVYNESQQSALSAFTSPLQNSGSLYARISTLFKSAGLSYGRKGIERLVGAYRALRGLPAQESIVVQSMVPDEADFVQLPQQETNVYGKIAKSVASMAGAWLFLQGLNLIWNGGGMYLVGFPKGVSAEDFMAEMTDDESSVNMLSALLAVHPYAERTYNAFTGKAQSDLGGTLIEDVWRDWNKYKKQGSYGQAAAVVAKAALVAGTGVQLETFGNMVTGVEGMLTDGSVDYEDIQYVLNSPQMSGIFRNAKGKYGGMLRRGEVSGSEYIGRMLFALKCNDLGEKGFVLDSRRGYTDYDVDKVLGEYVDIVAPDYSDWKERNKDAEVPESKPERFRAVDNTMKRLREIYKSGDASRRGEVDELHRGLVKLLSEMPQRQMDERLAADEALLKEYSRLQRENGKASALEFLQEHRREIERAKRYRRQRGVVDAKVNDFLDGLVPIEEVRRERERLDAVLLEE